MFPFIQYVSSARNFGRKRPQPPIYSVEVLTSLVAAPSKTRATISHT